MQISEELTDLFWSGKGISPRADEMGDPISNLVVLSPPAPLPLVGDWCSYT